MIDIFQKEGLLNKQPKEKNTFFVSDLTDSFQSSAARFYGENIVLKHKVL